MSRIVNPDRVPWGYQRNRGASKYPWEEWFDGKARRLTQGIDFESDPEHMRRQAYVAAKKKNVKIRTKVVKERKIVYVQALLDNQRGPFRR